MLGLLKKKCGEQLIVKEFFDYRYFSEDEVIIKLTPKTIETFIGLFKTKNEKVENWIKKLKGFCDVEAETNVKTEQEAIVLASLKSDTDMVFVVTANKHEAELINKTFKTELVYPKIKAIDIEQLKNIMYSDAKYIQIMKSGYASYHQQN